MSEPIKVSRSAAFVPLAAEIKRFGAMTLTEATERFGGALVEEAQRRRIHATRPTLLGDLVYLLHAGRKLAGVRGAYNHVSDDNLVNAAGLRRIGLGIEARGIQIDLGARKNSVVYRDDERSVLALFKHDGYDFAVLRRLYRDTLESGRFDEVDLYTLLAREEADKLARILYRPARGSPPLDADRLRLYVVQAEDVASGGAQLHAVRVE